MNFLIMLKKGVLGFLTGLAAVIVLGIVESMSNYNPTVCTATITENCTPQIVVSAYLAIIPTVTGLLVAVANWLKNRGR